MDQCLLNEHEKIFNFKESADELMSINSNTRLKSSNFSSLSNSSLKIEISNESENKEILKVYNYYNTESLNNSTLKWIYLYLSVYCQNNSNAQHYLLRQNIVSHLKNCLLDANSQVFLL